ncbi:septal ring lytic transglycosylase RlpA family protein [Gloeocapsopsis dulcis]|uniref:Probable endolytic peptidoglycan transglycosylase RlpA n=1 Tax=Gloeocapsopsis dulcis AAB1 = 1H9 TaxID=1433147 RepID=A0A6N8FUS5_9CHRO|nr:septal ring lytic transglycosylase RlpA family protein [Gloeocapsopsis dulcis]MUL36332.1 hypothetical protein [Gloeocapsopsis dulcis AAB1 = 1H9]WNN88172.1 septal ring lytic transglycosylase RlpA family protein [Gloeocapsopsis dulcis]
MNKKLLWTTAALLATAVGIPPSYAESTSTIEPSAVNESATPISTPKATSPVKVGEYQSPTRQSNSVVARIQPHQQAGRQAATIYVKNIPVLTFLDSDVVSSANTKPQTKVATSTNQADLSKADTASEANSAVRRATKVAAKINQLHLNGVDASKITAKWKANAAPDQGDRYAIDLNKEELVEINSLTRLPDQTKDLSEDALQATNRLRRLLGNAPPLQEVADKPAPKQVAAPQANASKQTKQNARAVLSGIASWYGPGFHGNRSASGERFNQNAMTAAHRSLPFGTKVRVTNKRNGRSVIVRINDRGPFTGGRIIDLSAAAARVLGVLNSGTAPVQVEVLGR